MNVRKARRLGFFLLGLGFFAILGMMLGCWLAVEYYGGHSLVLYAYSGLHAILGAALLSVGFPLYFWATKDDC
jgi:hypothetical protein